MWRLYDRNGRSRNGRVRNGRVRNGRSRIGRSRIGTSTLLSIPWGRKQTGQIWRTSSCTHTHPFHFHWAQGPDGSRARGLLQLPYGSILVLREKMLKRGAFYEINVN
jgi:hypothetical protein